MAIKFTQNKQVVRDLQCSYIHTHLRSRLGYLRYFGLSSPGMRDVRDWAALFAEFQVVERGQCGKEYADQHELLVTAAIHGLSSKVRLLRGDIDTLVLAGEDAFGNRITYPFDVVSLDYSGGLLYCDEHGHIPRLLAIEHLIGEQAGHGLSWLLLLSLRLDNPLNGGVKRALEDIRTELRRFGVAADEVIDRVMRHERHEVRFKIFVPYFINQVSAKVRYNCETEKAVMYEGNRRAPMMNFQFLLRPGAHTIVPRFPQERLAQIINSPLREVSEGCLQETSLGVPSLKVLQSGPREVDADRPGRQSAEGGTVADHQGGCET